MNEQVSKREIEQRIDELKKRMQVDEPNWEMIVIFSKVNQYYFTGSMQDGMLIITKEGDPIYWVRRTFERAMHESMLTDIRPMTSYRDAAAAYHKMPSTIYVESEVMSLAMSQRLSRYFTCEHFKSADKQIAMVRAVKSDY